MYAINGINVGLGPQHLGHYSGVVLASKHIPKGIKPLVLLDDLLSHLMMPTQRARVRNRTLFVAAEYLSLPDAKEIILVRASRLPSLLRWIHILSGITSSALVTSIYEHTFLARLLPLERDGLGLDPLPAEIERAYPALVLPALGIGTNSNFMFGSVEMDNYARTASMLVKVATGKPDQTVTMVTPRPENVLGTNGRYMNSQSAIYWSEAKDSVRKKIELALEHDGVSHQYLKILNCPIQNKASKAEVQNSIFAAWNSTFNNLNVKKMRAMDVEGELEANERRIEKILEKSSLRYLGL